MSRQVGQHGQVGQPPPNKRARLGDHHHNGTNGNKHQQQRPHPQKQQQHQQQQIKQEQQKQQQQQPQFHRLLEISQINLLSSEVQNWMYEQCALSEHIEIEAKLGRLLTYKEPNPEDIDIIHNNGGGHGGDEQKGEEIRIYDKIGLKSLAWIDLHKTGGYFESTVTEEVFRHLNGTFNKWYANCNSIPQRRIPALQKIPFPKLKYKRNRTVDKIYQQNGDKSSSVRVTIDMKDPNHIKEVIEKKKKSSMNICYPKSKWDIRISASIENVVPKPQNQIVSSLRCKDRISYQYDYFSIDITSTYTYSEALTPSFIQNVIERFKNKQELPLDRQYGTLRTYEVELEIVDHKYLNKVRKLAAEQRQLYHLQQLSYFFTQAAIQLAELSSNLRFEPTVCKLPGKKKPSQK